MATPLQTAGTELDQLTWFKKEPSFHWLNIASGGERLALSEIAKTVKEWFLHDTPLPTDWDGSCLQTLVRHADSDTKCAV